MAGIEDKNCSHSSDEKGKRISKDRNLEIFMFVFDSLLFTAILVFVKFFSADKTFDGIAVCELEANEVIIGSLYFKADKQGIEVFGNLTTQDLPSKYALRVHQFGVIKEQCSKTGQELSDEKERTTQSSHVNHVAHIGYIHFISSSENVMFRIRKMKLSGKTSVVGRSLVLRRYVGNETRETVACCSIVHTADID